MRTFFFFVFAAACSAATVTLVNVSSTADLITLTWDHHDGTRNLTIPVSAGQFLVVPLGYAPGSSLTAYSAASAQSAGANFSQDHQVLHVTTNPTANQINIMPSGYWDDAPASLPSSTDAATAWGYGVGFIGVVMVTRAALRWFKKAGTERHD